MKSCMRHVKSVVVQIMNNQRVPSSCNHTSQWVCPCAVYTCTTYYEFQVMIC